MNAPSDAACSQEANESDPALCRLCAGPVRICGGTRRCGCGHLGALERRWIAAIRLVHAGLCLTPTAASLWGGTLLRLAGLLTRGTSVSPTFARSAAEYTDPGGALSSEAAANLAVLYLQRRDVDRLDELFRSLREASAPWLSELRILVPRAALATPLEHARFALFAVPCVECAAAGPVESLFTHVGTYDAAIQCPRCGLVVPHPLPVRIGAPHPVGRCLGAEAICLAHDGHALDPSGLCRRGRATMVRAQREAANIDQAVTAHDRELLDALERAREAVPAGFIATVAAVDPRAASELVRIPNLGRMLRLGEELALSLDSGLDTVFGEPTSPALPVSAPRPARRRRRKRAKR